MDPCSDGLEERNLKKTNKIVWAYMIEHAHVVLPASFLLNRQSQLGHRASAIISESMRVAHGCVKALGVGDAHPSHVYNFRCVFP